MPPRDEKVTPAQKECLVNFMESNLEFAPGKLLCKILCQQLNGIGREKTVPKWQRLKTKIKRKASSVSASQGRTGGGPPTETPLTDVEEKVVFIISREGVYESDQPSLDNPMPSTSTNQSWVTFAEEAETLGTDVESVLSTEASTISCNENSVNTKNSNYNISQAEGPSDNDRSVEKTEKDKQNLRCVRIGNEADGKKLMQK
ncbi:hypothetical protein CBL_10035 [Carabus blaptoides fortunei]